MEEASFRVDCFTIVRAGEKEKLFFPARLTNKEEGGEGEVVVTFDTPPLTSPLPSPFCSPDGRDEID